MDPFTGRTLGSFGAGFMRNPIAMDIRGEEAWVLDSSGVRAFNIHTGRLVSETRRFNSFTDIRVNGEGVWVSGGSSLFRLNLLTGSATLQHTYPQPIVGFEFFPDGTGLVAALSNSTARVTRRSDFATLQELFESAPATAIGLDNRGTIGYFSGPAGGNLDYRSVPNASSGWVSGGWDDPQLPRGEAIGFGAGHLNSYLLSGTASTGNRVFAISTGPFGFASAYSPLGFVGPAFPNALDMEVYVAPEPGTILALGAGLAALVARRRRKNTL